MDAKDSIEDNASHCAKDALTNEFGWTVQAVLAMLAFTCLVCKSSNVNYVAFPFIQLLFL